MPKQTKNPFPSLGHARDAHKIDNAAQRTHEHRDRANRFTYTFASIHCYIPASTRCLYIRARALHSTAPTHTPPHTHRTTTTTPRGTLWGRIIDGKSSTHHCHCRARHTDTGLHYKMVAIVDLRVVLSIRALPCVVMI